MVYKKWHARRDNLPVIVSHSIIPNCSTYNWQTLLANSFLAAATTSVKSHPTDPEYPTMTTLRGWIFLVWALCVSLYVVDLNPAMRSSLQSSPVYLVGFTLCSVDADVLGLGGCPLLNHSHTLAAETWKLILVDEIVSPVFRVDKMLQGVSKLCLFIPHWRNLTLVVLQPP